jgi:glycosyltransferase involved in cell wall biosynthesis
MTEIVPVSVIVPVRNAAAHLAAALASVQAQQPAPAEVIVIDGGSTDDTVAIARAHGTRVIAQDGRGLGAARNQAIRASQQPNIAFCDGDDRWATRALANRMDVLATNPQAWVITGRVIREQLVNTAASAAQLEQVGRPVPGFTPGAMVARRCTFEEVGFFDETLKISSDSEWFVRLQQSPNPAIQIDDVVLYKGVRGNSLSSDVEAYRRELLSVARWFIGQRRGQPLP